MLANAHLQIKQWGYHVFSYLHENIGKQGIKVFRAQVLCM